MCMPVYVLSIEEEVQWDRSENTSEKREKTAKRERDVRELTQHKENDEPAESIQDRIYKHVYSKQVRTLLQARMTRSEERGARGARRRGEARRERRTRLPLGPPWSSPFVGSSPGGSFPLFSGP